MVDESAEEVCLLREQIKDIKKKHKPIIFSFDRQFLRETCPTSKVRSKDRILNKE